MLYNLCLHINDFQVASAVAVALVFAIIFTVKEKRHERKRA